MLLEISRKWRHGLFILLAEKGSPAQIAVQVFLRWLPFPSPLKVRNASRTLVLVCGDRSQIVEGLGNRRAEVMNERSGLRTLFRCYRSRHVFLLLILLRTLSCPVFRGAARGGAKLLAKFLGQGQLFRGLFSPRSSLQKTAQYVMSTNRVILGRRRIAQRRNRLAQKRLGLRIASGS